MTIPCKVCYYHYHESRDHCPVCGTCKEPSLPLYKSVDNKFIAASHGCVRMYQDLRPYIPRQAD